MTSCVRIKIDIYWYLCILILKRKSENLIEVFFVIRVYGDDVNLTSCRQKESVLQVCFHLIKHVSYPVKSPHIFSNVWNWKVLLFLKNHSRVFWKIEAPSFFQGREQPVHQPHNGNSLLWLSVSSLNKNKNLKLLFRVILKKGINPR